MKEIILSLALALVSLPANTVTYAGVPLVSDEVLQTAPLSTTTVALFVKQIQRRYNLSDDFYKTMEYESDGFQNIQSEVPSQNGPNGFEDSWGIAQIHLPDHPTISRAQALNVRFAVTWAAQRFAAGYEHEWSGWRKLFGDTIKKR